MLFEQDEVTIGRAQTNDVVVRDPKVSKAHAVIEMAPTGHHVVRDCESKNATFVDAERVHPEAPALLTPGTTVHLGDSTFSYMPLVPATDAESSSPSASTSADDVLHDDLQGVMDMFAQCLTRIALAQTRSDDLSRGAAKTIVEQYLDAMPERAQEVLQRMGDQVADGERHATDEPAPDDAWGTLPATLRDLLMLPESVWTHLDEPPSARRNPFLENPTTADVEAALRVRDATASDADVFQQLCTALQYVIVHHQALLQGYRASIKTGGQALLRRISPRDSSPATDKTGVFTRVFGGSDNGMNWERLERQWRKLYHSNWSEVEEKLFRPTLLTVYREYVQQPPDTNESPLAAPTSTPETAPSS